VTSAEISVASDSALPKVEVTSLFASANPRKRSHVLLVTARVRIEAGSGRSVVVRALLDQGSEATFISEALAQALRVKHLRSTISISAVGGTQIGTVRQAAHIIISSLDGTAPPLETTAFILPSLTPYTPKQISGFDVFPHLANLNLADSELTSSDPIQILIGADLYGDSTRRG